MAQRPVYKIKSSYPYYECINVEFTYNGGFAVSQKQKNIQAIHEAYKAINSVAKVLEISSKSLQPLGVSLSAFNLLKKVHSMNIRIPVENVYQGGKIFEMDGPFLDLYKVKPKDAKRDERLKENGRIKAFYFEGERFPINPQTAFYDWIYINAILENEDLAREIVEYDAFSDVEFNPEKSINCQARAAAIFVSLYRLDKLHVARSFRDFVALWNIGEMRNTLSISFELCDITKIDVDAIVNASDKKLSGGGGIDKAIHNAAGREELKEVLKEQTLDTGEAIITPGFKLPAKYIIHTAGPKYKDGRNGEKELLKSSYRSCLDLAKEYRLNSIAFCSISTGVFRYPLEEAANIAITTIKEWFRETKYCIDVRFAFIDKRTKTVYEHIYEGVEEKKKEKPNETITPFKTSFLLGDDIVHKAFGKGKISSIDLEDNDAKITVDFVCGQKILSEKTCKQLNLIKKDK